MMLARKLQISRKYLFTEIPSRPRKYQEILLSNRTTPGSLPVMEPLSNRFQVKSVTDF